MKEKRYIRFWFAVILASAVISLLGCMPARQVEMVDVYDTGGLFVENDSIVGTDTLYIWKCQK